MESSGIVREYIDQSDAENAAIDEEVNCSNTATQSQAQQNKENADLRRSKRFIKVEKTTTESNTLASKRRRQSTWEFISEM